MVDQPRQWIDDLEIENAKIKWNWSNFDGNDNLSGPGNYNFTIILDPEQAQVLADMGWNVKRHAGLEEGDPDEFTLKANISYRFEAPKVYMIKGERKFRVHEAQELADIRRDSLEQLDVILSPSPWKRGIESGITAYVKELYAKVRQSRFSERYSDYEDA